LFWKVKLYITKTDEEKNIDEWSENEERDVTDKPK
jgi:hypothetical protein